MIVGYSTPDSDPMRLNRSYPVKAFEQPAYSGQMHYFALINGPRNYRAYPFQAPDGSTIYRIVII